MTRLARPRSRPHGGGPPALGQRQRQRDRRKRQHRDGVHDYQEIFAVPGLSERIFHDHLECRSAAEVAGLLGRQVASDGVHPVDTTAFRWLIADLARSGALEVCDRERYRHRLSIHREPLDYVAVVGRKRRHAGRFHRVTSRDRRGPDRRANAPIRLQTSA